MCQILGWSVLVRVDGLTYSFLGDVLPNLNNGTVNLTSTADDPHANRGYCASWANASQSHLPKPYRGSYSLLCYYFQRLQMHHLKPGDWVRQSIPFSYMAFTATSTDGASHTVQVYSDVSGGRCIPSSTPVVSQLRYRVELGRSNASDYVDPDVQFRCRLPQCHTPNTGKVHGSDRPSGMGYAILCHAGRESIAIYHLSYSRSLMQGKNVSIQIASDTASRGNFTHNGVLNNQQDPVLSAIIDNFAVFAISRDLGTIKTTQAPVVWAIGYTTDPAINYTDLSGAPPTSRSPYYKTQYQDDESLASIEIISCGDMSNNKVQIVDFLNDFSNATSRAQQLDKKILQDANNVSNNLGDSHHPGRRTIRQHAADSRD